MNDVEYERLHLIAAQARKRAGGGVVHPRSHCKWRCLDQHLMIHDQDGDQDHDEGDDHD